MVDFKDFVNGLGIGIQGLAQKEVGNFAQDAANDSVAFFTKMQSDFERWTQQLQNGELSAKDFASLLRGKKSLMEMNALTKKGLADAKIDDLKNKIIDLIVNNAIGIFLPK